jgi:hypothetical protein
MDATKGWPDNVLTTKEHIMSLYPPYHNFLVVDDSIEEGTILHHLTFSALSNEMIRWMIHYYSACLTVYDDEGRIPFHVAVEYDNIFLTQTFLEASPLLINQNDRDGDCVFYYVGVSTTSPKSNEERNKMLHILLDYTKDEVPRNFLLSDATDVGNAYASWLYLVMRARYHCKLIATIVEKRRLIRGNKDVSWLLSQYILATRMNDVWL